MPWLVSLLISCAGSVAARVLTSLGIGLVSFVALNALALNVVNNMSSNYNSMPYVISSLLNLAGFGTAFGTIASALIARASLMAIKRLMPI